MTNQERADILANAAIDVFGTVPANDKENIAAEFVKVKSALRAVTDLATVGAGINVVDFGAVGNGTTNDTAAFQAALDAAATQGGGIVFVPAGSYLLTAAIAIGALTTLLGEGNASRLIFSQTGSPNAGITITAVSDVAVRDLFIDHDGGTAASTKSAIHVDASSAGANFLFADLHIIDAAQDGIRIVGKAAIKTNAKVARCTVDGAKRHGIEFAEDCSGSVAFACRIKDANGDTSKHGQGLFCSGSGSNPTVGCSFTGNIVEGCENGIRMQGINNAATGNLVSGCLIDGIRLRGTAITATGNQVTGCTEQGIKSENGTDHTITGNVVTGCSEDGIMVRYTDAQPTGVSITGNTVTGNTQNGIRVYGGTDITITGNTVKGNGQNGIAVEGPTVGSARTCTEILIQGNNLRGNATGGSFDNIRVNQSGGTVDFVSIIGNRLNGDSAAVNGGINITVTPTTRIDVIENISFGHNTSDLSIPGGGVVYLRHTDFRTFAAPTMAAMNGSTWYATTGGANQAMYVRENTAWIEVGAM